MAKNRQARKPRVGDMSYRILCTTCHHGKSFGGGQWAANRAAGKHVSGLPHHVLVVLRETTLAVVTGTDGVDPLY